MKKHSISASSARRRPFHNIIPPKPLPKNTAVPNSQSHEPSPSFHRQVLSAYNSSHDFMREDFDTFMPPVTTPAPPAAPSTFMRALNRIRLVIGTLLILPGVLILHPRDAFNWDDFLFFFKKGTLP